MLCSFSHCKGLSSLHLPPLLSPSRSLPLSSKSSLVGPFSAAGRGKENSPPSYFFPTRFCNDCIKNRCPRASPPGRPSREPPGPPPPLEGSHIEGLCDRGERQGEKKRSAEERRGGSGLRVRGRQEGREPSTMLTDRPSHPALSFNGNPYHLSPNPPSSPGRPPRPSSPTSPSATSPPCAPSSPPPTPTATAG